jgi:transglutaminase-like putative cysteine protease/tetratricopeptide (TPR) repeat protein
MNTVLRATLVCAVALLSPLFALAAEPWDAPPLAADPKALLEAAQKIDPGKADTVVLFNESIHSADGPGRWHITDHSITLAVTRRGVERLASVTAGWQPWYAERPVIRARVIAKDGTAKTLEPEAITEASAGYQRDIFTDLRYLHAPLPGVAVGSLVESVIDTKYHTIVPGDEMNGFFTFATVVPTEHARFIVDGPAGFAPKFVNETPVQPRVVETNGRKQWIFESGHTDAIELGESYLPPEEAWFKDVMYAAGSSWSELARGYSAIVDKQIEGNDVRSIAAAATAGATAQKEVIDRLLAYVQANVRYAGVEVAEGSIVPRPPKFVLEKKYGDCKDKATLLVALLRAADIPAHVALLKSGFFPDVRPQLPTMNQFNHAIVVSGGQTPVWIDPTDEFARAGELPYEDQGRLALIADSSATALTRTPELPASAQGLVEMRTFRLPEEGRAHVREVTEGFGAPEALQRRYRAELETKTYDEMMVKLAKSMYAADGSVKLSAGDPRDLSKPFHLTVDVANARAGSISNGEGTVSIPLRPLIGVPEVLKPDSKEPQKKRVHDFYFPAPLSLEWRYRIVLPQGYLARTLPANETKHLGSVMLTEEFGTESDGVVFANLRFDSGKRRLTPAEFEETRREIGSVIDKEVMIGITSVGQSKLSAGDIRGALGEFRALAATHPNEALHHIEISRALLIGGLGEAARDEARRALALEPSSALTHAALARAYEHDLLGRHLHQGCDLAAAITEMKTAVELDPRALAWRASLAELYTFGVEGARFGRNARLQDAITIYQGVVTERGAEAKRYQPRLMVILSHAGKWKEMKTLVDSMDAGEQKSLGQILGAAITSKDAALKELERYPAETRRTHARKVAAWLVGLRRYSDAAALYETATDGNPETQTLIQALRRADRAEEPSVSTARGTVVSFIQDVMRKDMAHAKTLLLKQQVGSYDRMAELFVPRVLPIHDLTPDALAELVPAAMDFQVDGNDSTGYRVRFRFLTVTNPAKHAFFLRREEPGLMIAASLNDVWSVGFAALDFAAANKFEAARTWLNWAREDISPGGGDDPLAGSAFAALWPKEKAGATPDEIRLAAAALTVTAPRSKSKPAEILLASRDTAKDEQKQWIDAALARATDDPAKAAALYEPLATSHPDSAWAFTQWTLSLASSGKVAESESAARQRLERSPRDHAALRSLSLTAARKGDYAASVAYARRIVTELTPNESDHNTAAWAALFAGKDLDQAIEDARKASQTRSRIGAEASLTLASLYAESGKDMEAHKALLQAIDWRDEDVPASEDWYVIGRIAENYGLPDAALAAYNRVQKTMLTGQSVWELTQRRLAALSARK